MPAPSARPTPVPRDNQPVTSRRGPGQQANERHGDDEHRAGRTVAERTQETGARDAMTTADSANPKLDGGSDQACASDGTASVRPNGVTIHEERGGTEPAPRSRPIGDR
jgi:hypothetical protein